MRYWRILTAIVFVGVAIVLVLGQRTVRGFEAVGAEHLLTPFGAVGSNLTRAVVWFQFGPNRAIGLIITPECTAALLLVPVLLAGVALLARRSIGVGRVLVAVTVAALIIVFGNLVRIGAIAWLIDHLGVETGYALGHTVIGSLISVGVVGLALFAMYRAAVGGRRRVRVG
jgi:exosortase/archaeosortase family protein